MGFVNCQTDNLFDNIDASKLKFEWVVSNVPMLLNFMKYKAQANINIHTIVHCTYPMISNDIRFSRFKWKLSWNNKLLTRYYLSTLYLM